RMIEARNFPPDTLPISIGSTESRPTNYPLNNLWEGGALWSRRDLQGLVLRPDAEGNAPQIAGLAGTFPATAAESPMAKRGNSVIGIDLGKRAYKAVLLNKKSETRYALSSFASHEVPEEVTTADDVAQHIEPLLKDLVCYTNSCASILAVTLRAVPWLCLSRAHFCKLSSSRTRRRRCSAPLYAITG